MGFYDLTVEETEAQERETLEQANGTMVSVAWLTPAPGPFPPPQESQLQGKSEKVAFDWVSQLPEQPLAHRQHCGSHTVSAGGKEEIWGWNVRG